jgi:hypothetical protein
MTTAFTGKKIRPRARPVPGAMNKTEQQYADYLQKRLLGGEIISYRFEALKLRLADKTFYTPDFIVTFSDQIECHEVKGFWRDDARVKIKVAAALFPEFAFMAVTKRGKGWDYEPF